jgi:hypothetical protein
MRYHHVLPFALLGTAHAVSIEKRFSNGDFATGDMDPNVSSGCTYWANSITASDTCAVLESYLGITVAQLTSWVSIRVTEKRFIAMVMV